MRQLRNFKDAKYGNSQIKLILEADELEEKMRMGLSMETSEFVASTLSRILNPGLSSTSDFVNFSRIYSMFPLAGQSLL